MAHQLPPLKQHDKYAKLAETLDRLVKTDAKTIAEMRKQSPYYVGFAKHRHISPGTKLRHPVSTTPTPQQMAHLRLSDEVYKLGTSLHYKGASVPRFDRAEASFDVDELKRVRLHTLLKVAYELLEDRRSHDVPLSREEAHWLGKITEEWTNHTEPIKRFVEFAPLKDGSGRSGDHSSGRMSPTAAEQQQQMPLVRLGTLRIMAQHPAVHDHRPMDLSLRSKQGAEYVPLVGATKAVIELLQEPHTSEAARKLGGSLRDDDRLESIMQWVRDDAQAGSHTMHKKLLEFAIKCAAAPKMQRAEVLSSIAHQIETFTHADRASVWYMLDDCLIRNDEADALNIVADVPSEALPIEKRLLLACSKSLDPLAEAGVFIVPISVKRVFLGAIVVENAALAKNKSYEEFVSMLKLQAGFAELYLRSQMTFLELQRAQEGASILLTLANRLVKANFTIESKEASGLLTDEEINMAEHSLVKSIIGTVRDLTESDRCSVFLVRGDNLQAYFDETSDPVVISTDLGIAGHVARTGETIRLADAYEDERFNGDVDRQTGYRTKSLLSMPVYYEGEIVAVAQLVNKSDLIQGTPRFFTDRDEELFATFAMFIGICLHNLRVNIRLSLERRKTDALFGVAQKLAKVDISDVANVADIILKSATHLAHADRGTLFLVDREHDELISVNTEVDIRIPCGSGIAGSVVRTGMPDIIDDAYLDARFNQAVDSKTGYRTRSMVTVPVRVSDAEVVAVAQLVNRIGGQIKVDPATNVGVFSNDDLQLLEGFAAFAGMALHNAQLVEFAVKAADEATSMLSPAAQHSPAQKTASFANRQRDMVERLSTWWYHLYDGDDASPEASQGIDELGVKTLNFDVTKLMGRAKPTPTARDTGARIVAAIIDQYAAPFGLPRADLNRFVVACREKYRNVPYHNFFHAVDVVQTLFVFLKIGHAEELLLPIERLALVVAGLCHDLDHMGLNNSFYLKTDSPLGILSSTTGTKSVMEVHHCNEAVEILAIPGADVFAAPKITPEERKIALMSLIRCILATDMLRHKEIVDQFKAECVGLQPASDAPKFDPENSDHRSLLMQMLLKAADISNVTKPFPISKVWAERVTEEFYSQGDREKEIGVGQVPAMFDREAGLKLADGQIGFIDFVARPFFATLKEFDARMQPWIEQLETNSLTWKKMKADSAS